MIKKLPILALSLMVSHSVFAGGFCHAAWSDSPSDSLCLVVKTDDNKAIQNLQLNMKAEYQLTAAPKSSNDAAAADMDIPAHQSISSSYTEPAGEVMQGDGSHHQGKNVVTITSVFLGQK